MAFPRFFALTGANLHTFFETAKFCEIFWKKNFQQPKIDDNLHPHHCMKFSSHITISTYFLLG